jgi:hypothetical protein
MNRALAGDAIDEPTNRWRSAVLDVVAFVFGCGVAWWRGWRTPDLIWSLWLSSLVVGYVSIVWMIIRDRWSSPGGTPGSFSEMPVAPIWFLLGFFTLHFGIFHFVHSVFLNVFFPVIGRRDEFPEVNTYIAVVTRYWVFLPAAFLAERAIFVRKASTSAFADERPVGDWDFVQPYKNVFRMHVLIFFFLAASLAKWDGVIVFVVVYAVYFFPWRLLRKAPPCAAAR